MLKDGFPRAGLIFNNGLKFSLQPMAQFRLNLIRERRKRQLVAIGEEAGRNNHETGGARFGFFTTKPDAKRDEDTFMKQTKRNPSGIAISNSAKQDRKRIDTAGRRENEISDHLLPEILSIQLGNSARIENLLKHCFKQFKLTAKIPADQSLVNPSPVGNVAHSGFDEAFLCKNLLPGMKNSVSRSIRITCFAFGFRRFCRHNFLHLDTM